MSKSCDLFWLNKVFCVGYCASYSFSGEIFVGDILPLEGFTLANLFQDDFVMRYGSQIYALFCLLMMGADHSVCE